MLTGGCARDWAVVCTSNAIERDGADLDGRARRRSTARLSL
jgi:hypothetical protein